MNPTPAGSTVDGAAVLDLAGRFQAAYNATTAGTWKKGESTHETVAALPGLPDYRIADFRHADDAQFCDVAHELAPAIIKALRSLSPSPVAAQQEGGVGRVDGDGHVTWFEPIPEDGAFLYARPGAAAAAPSPVVEPGAQAGRVAELLAEIDRLNAIINTPHADDFIKAVSIEAEHQRQRWGAEGDAGKTSADWFWLVGYLAGKALHSHAAANVEKAEHHIITTAAACANWHRGVFGRTNMRPGHEDGIDAARATQGERNAD